jgi:ElaB/YqjD/DUF883 family membrane-anchored ribosome-binding protein
MVDFSDKAKKWTDEAKNKADNAKKSANDSYHETKGRIKEKKKQADNND